MKTTLFRGAGTALVTPFTPDGALDLVTLEKLIKMQLEKQIDALVVCGTTGESATLTDREKEEIFELSVSLCKNKIPVIAGVGSNDTLHTIQLAQSAEHCGVDGLLIVTPYYNKTSQTGVLQHYTAIAEKTSLPILLYNVPSRTGMNLTPQTVQKLAELPNIVGIKEASGNIAQTAEICARCPSDFSVYSGNDAEALAVLALGGDGVISVASNLLPDVIHCLCNFYWNGNEKISRQLQLMLIPLINLLFENVNPIPVKALMEAIGIPCGPCRLPLEQLNEQQRAALIHKALPLLMRHYPLSEKE